MAEDRKRRSDAANRDTDDQPSNKRAVPDPNGPGNYMKCLIPNGVAGMIIGKDGANIQKLTQDYGVNIRVSSSKAFFPGTQLRIVSVMGSLRNVDGVLSWLLGKMAESPPGVSSGEAREVETSLQLRILVSNVSSGVVIGKGGSTIKGLQTETGTQMTISQKDASANLPERVLTITGSRDRVHEAAMKVLTKVQSEEDAAALMNLLNYTAYPPPTGNVLGNMSQSSSQSSGPPSAFDVATMYKAQAQVTATNPFLTSQTLGFGLSNYGDTSGVDMTQPGATRCTIEVAVPEYLCGAVLGSGGQSINELQQMSGASVKISNRGDYVPGSYNRIATITGSYGVTHTGYYLLMQKLSTAFQSSGLSQSLTTTPNLFGQVNNTQIFQELQSYYNQLSGTNTTTSTT